MRTAGAAPVARSGAQAAMVPLCAGRRGASRRTTGSDARTARHRGPACRSRGTRGARPGRGAGAGRGRLAGRRVRRAGTRAPGGASWPLGAAGRGHRNRRERCCNGSVLGAARWRWRCRFDDGLHGASRAAGRRARAWSTRHDGCGRRRGDRRSHRSGRPPQPWRAGELCRADAGPAHGARFFRAARQLRRRPQRVFGTAHSAQPAVGIDGDTGGRGGSAACGVLDRGRHCTGGRVVPARQGPQR